MRGNLLSAAALTLALGISAQGCIILTPNSGSVDYYRTGCTTSADCRGAGFCQTANTAISGQSAGIFCTTSCTTSSSCFADNSGVSGVCVSTASSSQCYRPCGGSFPSCPGGTVCGGPPGMQQYCVPGTGTVVVQSYFQPNCTSNAQCSGTLQCKPANTMLSTQSTPTTFCTAVCNSSSDCSNDLDGTPSSCVTANGGGLCYRTCGTGYPGCPGGTTCTGTGTGSYCIPGT